MQLTTEQIQAEIANLTAKLDGDDRPTRPEDPNDKTAIRRPIVRDEPDERGTLRTVQIDESIELPTASAIRAERAAWKAQRRALRKELELRKASAFDPTGTVRPVEAIEADIEKVGAARAELLEASRALTRERDQALLRAEIEDMPPAKRAALEQVLGARGIPSSAKVGTPGGR